MGGEQQRFELYFQQLLRHVHVSPIWDLIPPTGFPTPSPAVPLPGTPYSAATRDWMEGEGRAVGARTEWGVEGDDVGAGGVRRGSDGGSRGEIK